MQSNMNVDMVWAGMLGSSDAVEHERYYGWGMDDLVIGCSRTGAGAYLSSVIEVSRGLRKFAWLIGL